MILAFSISNAQIPLQPIGQWREHLPYQSTTSVISANNKIYAATPYNVFSVADDGTINRLSKITGLTDVGINAIGWDSITNQLVIGYTSSNIDIVKDKIVKTIADIKRSNISGDKSIYNIYCNQGKAYLCTGLGIIVIDLARYEVLDTWKIGSNGQPIKINDITLSNGFFYAATVEGLKRAPVTANNLANYQAWQMVSGSNGLNNGEVRAVTSIDNKVVVLFQDKLMVLQNGNWSLLYTDLSFSITRVNSQDGKLLVSLRNTAGSSRVLVLSSTGNIERSIAQPGVISYPLGATYKNGEVWVADLYGGLSKFGNAVERFIPDGPLGIATGEMVVKNKILYAAAGSVNDAWNYQYNRNGLYTFNGNNWNNINQGNTPILDSALDLITLAIDPVDKSIWAGSYGGGLINIKPGSASRVFKQNSTLQPAIGDPTSYRVSGLAFDADNNLWISNYGASQNLHVRKANGTFKALTIPFFHSENAVSQVLVDDAHQVWIVSPKGNGLFVYQPGNIDNLADDKWKYFRQGRGSGNLPSNEVYCMAKDKHGFIWIGTSKGIGIIQCPEQLFDVQGCEAILPVVQQDRFAGYLFRDEEVRTIAVDGANRKWVGTKNGLWLISDDGEKIIYRFTEDNSPLLSNDVKQVTIDPATGEVYIATFKGICSFRSTATEGSETSNNVLVFPNPVPPGYSGTIAIRGLSTNATVKIAELNGRLVFETRALGGQAIWDGKNYNGEKIASGVYLVLVKGENGTDKLVTKIIITRGR